MAMFENSIVSTRPLTHYQLPICFYKCETQTTDKKIIIHILVIIMKSANFVPNPLPAGTSILNNVHLIGIFTN